MNPVDGVSEKAGPWRRRFATPLAVLCLITAALIAVVVAMVVLWGRPPPAAELAQGHPSQPQPPHPLFPPGVGKVPEPRPVVGNLGGLPVTFPPGFAHLVEYDGDPGFGEKRTSPIPVRTHQSGIRSMGFEVRYRDFKVTTFKEREADKRNYTIRNTPWIDVGVIASSYFGDGQYLERSFRDREFYNKFKYKRLPERQFGLDVYTPIDVDVSKRQMNPKTKAYSSDYDDQDMFFYFDEKGRVDAYIKCSNRQHQAVVCQHSFFISMKFKVKITAQYRRGQLEHWKKIQSSIRELVMGFKAN